MRANTDSDGEVRFDAETSRASATYFRSTAYFSGISIEQLEKKASGQRIRRFQKRSRRSGSRRSRPIQQKYNDVMESGELDKILKEGAEKAGAIAQKTLRRVKENFGLGL